MSWASPASCLETPPPASTTPPVPRAIFSLLLSTRALLELLQNIHFQPGHPPFRRPSLGAEKVFPQLLLEEGEPGEFVSPIGPMPGSLPGPGLPGDVGAGSLFPLSSCRCCSALLPLPALSSLLSGRSAPRSSWPPAWISGHLPAVGETSFASAFQSCVWALMGFADVDGEGERWPPGGVRTTGLL